MSTIKTINTPDGKQVKAKELEFNILKEDWSQYALADGTVVKLRTTVMKILQILDDNGMPAMNPDGDPLLFINHKTDVITSG